MTLAGRLISGTLVFLAVTIAAVAVSAEASLGDVFIPSVVALAAGAGLAGVAARALRHRLQELSRAARAIAEGGQPRYPHRGIAEVDAVTGPLREMHEQMSARVDVLRHRLAESGTLVNAMVEGVLSCDARGRMVTANPAARRLLGYPEGPDLPALPMLFHEKAAREIVSAALRGETVEDREIDLDGRICLLSARALPEGGAVLVLHDLTQVRRLEAIRRDFVANVSHELKTPLTSISGYAETLLADSPDPATSRRFLETILANARRMQRLVDDQLDLAKLESGQSRPAPQEVRTEAAFWESWESLTRPSPPDLEFSAEIGPGAESVYADPEALRQVLGNLFDNSRRHTPARGRILAAARAENGGIRLSVSDTGAGIPSEHLPRIFERFYRADVSRSRAGGGTGLGLAIVKHTVEAHGGRVWAESVLGQGTTIHCWFPPEKEAVTRL